MPQDIMTNQATCPHPKKGCCFAGKKPSALSGQHDVVTQLFKVIKTTSGIAFLVFVLLFMPYKCSIKKFNAAFIKHFLNGRRLDW